MNKNTTEAFAQAGKDFATHIGGFEYRTEDGPRTARPHEMTVLWDAGPYRHLRFGSPDHGHYRFDVLTTPNTLLFRGVGESLVFGGAQDVMQLFRASSDPYYLSGKLVSGGGRPSVLQYSRDVFTARVKEHVAEAIRMRITPRGIGRAVTEMLRDDWLEHEACARRALEDFDFGGYWRVECACGEAARREDYSGVAMWRLNHRGDGHRIVTEKRVEGYGFYDTWEWTFWEFDTWFLWACHAIAWAVAQYDKARKAATASA